MQLDFRSEIPIYLQIAEELEDAIVTGAFAEGTQIPSTTEFSGQLKINPATVLKGMNLLVEKGILYKKRGIGMFVAEGAVRSIREARQSQFFDQFIIRMLEEARKLGLSQQEVLNMVERGFDSDDHRD